MAVGTARLKPNTLDVHLRQYRSIEAHISWSEDARTELDPASRLDTCVWTTSPAASGSRFRLVCRREGGRMGNPRISSCVRSMSSAIFHPGLCLCHVILLSFKLAEPGPCRVGG